MNTLEWYNKLARHCEDTPALGGIQYKQIELIAEFIAKVEAAQHGVQLTAFGARLAWLFFGGSLLLAMVLIIIGGN